MLALRIAFRYLFSKKSHNAINAITLVASCGIAIITAAMICVLSVFNGFEALVGSLCSNFDPELRIEAKKGKTFADTDSLRSIIVGTEGVDVLSAVLEENVLLSYSQRQIPAKMMGVDDVYPEVTLIDSIILTGELLLKDEVADYCILGGGLASMLGTGSSFVRPITVFCPQRSGKINLLNPKEAFNEAYLYCSSIFLVNQAEYDDNVCITSLDFARRMLHDSIGVSAYALKLKPGYEADDVKQSLSSLTDKYVIKTRYEQQEDSFRIMQVEKWITFLIVIFILLIASFNVVGALSMLIIDKESEIITLRNLGASEKLIRYIFACEGLLVSGIGAMSGILLGVVLCLVQEHYGVIGLGGTSGAYIIDAYPVVLTVTDVIYSAIAVFVVGILSSLYPLTTISRIK